ncbi:MAG TPA: class II aldolase, partial [Spirochaetaceae bacterium]|nr:class II aldolase [Spirochaetaceae bacterium]
APFTPDHIVYAGAWPLFVSQKQAQDPASLQEQIDAYLARHGELPKILAVQGLGIFGLGKDIAAAERACLLFTDAAKIAWYAEAFGGAHPMESADIEFIRTWEVEKYRSSIASENSVAASKQ